MLTAVRGVVRGNTVVVEDGNLEDFDGAEVVITLLNQPARKKTDKQSLKEIQSMFAKDKGWNSEEEMIADMAKFRRERMSK